MVQAVALEQAIAKGAPKAPTSGPTDTRKRRR
jgi:hypothetical protein